MRTMHKLDNVYKEAERISFDKNSKFVFFSDAHRGDDSVSDEFGKNKHIFYHALNYYYKNEYTYVEVGDGDELWEHPDFQVIRNAHFSVFNKLKEFYDDNRMLMIFGNHNMDMKNPQWVERNMYYVYDDYLGTKDPLFPGLKVKEAYVFEHESTGKEFFVVHGHQGDALNDQLAFLSKFFIRVFWRFMHHVGIQYAASPAQSRLKRHKVEKNYSKWIKRRGVNLICGHTHRPKLPDPGNGPAYFNIGCSMHPRGITCLEMNGEELVLVTWRVHTRADGTLFIKRVELKGPFNIEGF